MVPIDYQFWKEKFIPHAYKRPQCLLTKAVFQGKIWNNVLSIPQAPNLVTL